MAMENLEIRKVTCFGWQYPRSLDWWRIGNMARSRGWKAIATKQFKEAFAQNIDESYMHLFDAVFVDLDSSIEYHLYFDNNKKLYVLELQNSKDNSPVLPDEKKAFFKSDMFKSTRLRANELVVRARDLYLEVIESHVKEGELLEVNEAKLEAIIDFTKDQILMKAFKLGKYLK